MARKSLRERIVQGVFVLDGAMGTELFARGVEVGDCTAYVNIESPEIVYDVHLAYFDSGSDAVITNTFGANRYALAQYGHSDKVIEINTAAAQIARRAAGEDKYVLGDIGPSGDFLEPLGALKADELKEAFSEQAMGLLAGQVDGFIIETMSALDELEIAIEAVKSICGDLPVFASMAFDCAGGAFKTMMGVDIESAVAKMASLGVDAIGFNCGRMSLDDYVKLAEKFAAAAAGPDVTLLAEPNAGQPELVDGRAVYNVSPEDFAAAAEKIHLAGVDIVGGCCGVIGGCCGTKPSHIKALAEKLKKI